MVYFIQAGDRGPIKIGYSKDPMKRMKVLQQSNAKNLSLLGTIEGDKRKEWAIHNFLGFYKMKGEWFKSSEPILRFIYDLVFKSPWARPSY